MPKISAYTEVTYPFALSDYLVLARSGKNYKLRPGTYAGKAAAPTADDDVNDGYQPGNLWIDETNGLAYICLDNSAAAAVWLELGSGGGLFVQEVYETYLTYNNTTTAMPIDDSIPQITEGGEVLTAAITPTSATNIIRIIAEFSGASSPNLITGVALFKVGTAAALAASPLALPTDARFGTVVFSHELVAGGTSEITFSMRAGNAAGSTTYFNGSKDGRYFGGVMKCALTLQEITV